MTPHVVVVGARDRAFLAQLHLEVDGLVAQVVELGLEPVGGGLVAAAETRHFVARVVHLILQTLDIGRWSRLVCAEAGTATARASISARGLHNIHYGHLYVLLLLAPCYCKTSAAAKPL